VRDHDPKPVKEFRGTYDRGEPEAVPLTHFIDSLNIRFLDNGIETREGSVLDLATGFVPIRWAVYKRIGEAPRILILRNNGELYDSVDFAGQPTPPPFLTIPGMTDFACQVMFNRAYISPHDGVRGLAGQSVYVYDGTICRVAGGPAPSGFSLVVTESAISGGIEAGDHLFAVAYETISGFITAPGPTVFPKLTASGGFKADISNIPLGPSGTVARWILATKRLFQYNGNQNDQEYFFVPNGRIPNNTATTLTVDFFDADLVNSADILFDLLSTIPAGSFLSTYKGMLIVGGENTADSIFRASAPGSPEAFSAVDGFGTVDPGDVGGPLTNAAEYRGQLILCKNARSYVTTATTDGSGASYWPIDSVDQSAGAFIHGVAEVKEKRTNILDAIVTADPTGLHLFRGSFAQQELTFNVQAIWERITEAAYKTVQVVIDSKLKKIYVSVPLDGAMSPSHILYGDYADGLDSENTCWTLWKYPAGVNSIGIYEEITGVTKLKFSVAGNNIYKMDDAALNDFGNAIDSMTKFALFRARDDESVCHFHAVRMRVVGSGVLQINIQNADKTINVDCPSLVLATSPGKSLTRIFNVVSEMASPRIRMNNINEKFKLTRFVMFVKTVWQSRSDA
jgi:hypothetical protein